MPPTADPASQFIIGQLQNEVSRFETLYNDERKSKKKVKKERDELRNKISEMELAAKIAEVKPPDKTTLEGLLEHPVIQGLLPHIGPAIGKLADHAANKMTAPGSPPSSPAANLEGNDESNILAYFLNWLSSQPAEAQGYVGELLVALTRVPDGITLVQKLLQVRNLVMDDYMRAAV